MAEQAASEGFRVGWGSGWPVGAAPPLWPWQQALTEVGAGRGPCFEEPHDVDSAGWFTQAAAVVEQLRELTAEQPTMLIIDDAHAADEPTVRLAHFVARHLRGIGCVLVIAHQPSPMFEAIDKDATELALRGLEPAEVAALLAQDGFDGLDPADLEFVTGATRGLPLEVRRLASGADLNAGVVRSLIDERLAVLPADLLHAAACAAALGAMPFLGDVGSIADDGVDPFVLVNELERLGLATRVPPEGLAFAHEQVRSALTAMLVPPAMLDIHARAVALLAQGPPSLERLVNRAEHALAAARRSVDDARVAVAIAEEAAAALVDANDPDRAAELLAAAEAAHERAGLGRPPATLLTAFAGAVLRCGRLTEASERYAIAAAAAEEDGDAVSLGRAALGMGGVWLAEQRSPIDRERVLGLQRRARDELPEDAVELRMRMDARLAAEAAYETGQFREIEAQVEAAREYGNPAVLAETLSLYHHTLLGPEHRDLRARVAAEMVTAATEADDNYWSLMALLWLTTDFFLAGRERAERSLAELHARADALAGRHVAYIASVMDVMLMQRAGRLDQAEVAANAAFGVGLEIGDADAIAYYGSQVVLMRWIQGRSAEVLELAAATAASPTIFPVNHAFTGVFASLAAECGQLDRARAALTKLRGVLGTIPQNSAWLATLFTTVEAAYATGDVDVAREAAELLRPYADMPVLGSLAVVCLGSARRSLGLAAVTVGDVDEGIELLEAAIVDNERLGNRPLAALTVADLAQIRSIRGRPGDRDAAVELFDRAIREADALDLPVRAAEWRKWRDALVDEDLQVTTTATDAEVGRIERHGSSWVIAMAGRQVAVPDLLGMNYLTRLLTNPGVEIQAAALVIDAGDTSIALAARDEQPVLDDTALASYRRRVTELEEEIAEAEEFVDIERAARARMELDAIVDELARTTNRFGRTRPFASSNERARTAVQKAVRRVLDHVESVDVEVGTLLRQSVRTGRTCCYQPAPGAPATWTITAG
jgi:tetratricopeptide (TPR) repeat protein